MNSADELAAYINAVGHLVESINVVTARPEPTSKTVLPAEAKRKPRGSKVNDTIVQALENGPMSAKDLRGTLEAAGLAPGSLSTGLALLQRSRTVKRLGEGLYGLATMQEAAE